LIQIKSTDTFVLPHFHKQAIVERAIIRGLK